MTDNIDDWANGPLGRIILAICKTHNERYLLLNKILANNT